ncbi:MULTISPECIES: tetratricopeptide repeat protein [Thiorhodovibrio]|uniref:tetratricopeptide repeat protein n=1 Tax=Thiorhodovibrio TaxID=61593 RepID=UPI00389A1D9E
MYRAILAAEPEDADALHLLGLAAHQAGDHETAESLIRKAINIERSNPAYYLNYGQVLKKFGRLYDALAAYDAALKISPEFFKAMSIAVMHCWTLVPCRVPLSPIMKLCASDRKAPKCILIEAMF